MKSTTLFLLGCFPVRVLLAYFAYIASRTTLKYMGYIAILPSIGFMYFYLSGTRKTGPETGGKPIWWNHLRPVHALLYATFAYLAINGDVKDHPSPIGRAFVRAWMVLAADVAVGLSAFLFHHWG